MENCLKNGNTNFTLEMNERLVDERKGELLLLFTNIIMTVMLWKQLIVEFVKQYAKFSDSFEAISDEQ